MEGRDSLLGLPVLEKAVYERGDELHNRVGIPLRSILELLAADGGAQA